MSKVFKSIWFKCITVLLAVALIAGGLLAILNQVLFVSAEERTGRAIKKIYGEIKEYDTILDVDDDTRGDVAWVYTDEGVDKATISKIYKVAGETPQTYDLLFKSEGGQGFKNGTITLWVKVVFSQSDGKYGIDKVILETFEKQTFMGKLGGDYYGGFKLDDVTEAYNDKEALFNPDPKDTGAVNHNPVSGATKSATAGCNAVNGVIQWIGENRLGE